jgi:DNA repair ATPase RecN
MDKNNYNRHGVRFKQRKNKPVNEYGKNVAASNKNELNHVTFKNGISFNQIDKETIDYLLSVIPSSSKNIEKDFDDEVDNTMELFDELSRKIYKHDKHLNYLNLADKKINKIENTQLEILDQLQLITKQDKNVKTIDKKIFNNKKICDDNIKTIDKKLNKLSKKIDDKFVSFDDNLYYSKALSEEVSKKLDLLIVSVNKTKSELKEIRQRQQIFKVNITETKNQNQKILNNIEKNNTNIKKINNDLDDFSTFAKNVNTFITESKKN